MSFVQHCFIRKNTPELCRKLEHIGYRHNYLDDNDRKWLAANHGMYISVDEGFDRLPLDDVDCGTNEELFLALAALRDDTDRNQWFVDDVAGVWERSESELPSKYMQLNGHKATPEEIVEHFKEEQP